MTIKWHNLLPGSDLVGGGSMTVLFFVVMVVARVACGIARKPERVLRIMDTLLCVSWGFMAFAYTILGRGVSSDASMELQLFWCVKKAWIEKNPQNWHFIVGNILLFIPLGVIVALLLKERCNVWWILLSGFLASLCIELMQLYTHKGLFELDDLFHNTLGCYVGYCVFVVARHMGRGDKRASDVSKAMFYVAMVSIVLLLAFFCGAAAMGQPVFEYMIGMTSAYMR